MLPNILNILIEFLKCLIVVFSGQQPHHIAAILCERKIGKFVVNAIQFSKTDLFIGCFLRHLLLLFLASLLYKLGLYYFLGFTVDDVNICSIIQFESLVQFVIFFFKLFLEFVTEIVE